MTERKMCRFYNLNIPERRSAELGPNFPNNEDNDGPPPPPSPSPPPNHTGGPEVPPNEHGLQHSYCLWFSRRPGGGGRGYEQALRLIDTVSSVEQWWGLYCHIARPSELPPQTDLHLFKLGIKPMWEDPANMEGGKWVVRLRKGQTGRAWEELCMAVLGEQFMVGNEICGIVLSVRFQEDHIAIWHRTSEDTASANAIRDTLRRVLQLQPGVLVEYKVHKDCLMASESRQEQSEMVNGSASTSSDPS